MLEAAQLAVGDVEEVPGPAGGIEDDVVEQLALKRLELSERTGRFDALAPRLDDARADDLLDIYLVRVVGTELAASLRAEGVLEERS